MDRTLRTATGTVKTRDVIHWAGQKKTFGRIKKIINKKKAPKQN